MISREELLSGVFPYPSFIEARNFALKISNYYDLDNEIISTTETMYLVVFTEQENE
jgi:hypothetical protein